MRLAELSERSGVSTATIKYYLREGLLAPGRQINARTAEYDGEHLRRLRLVRAMIQVGGVPVAKVREVLGHVDDDSLGRAIRLGAALWALPQVPEPDEDDEYVRPRTRGGQHPPGPARLGERQAAHDHLPRLPLTGGGGGRVPPARLRMGRRTARAVRAS